MFLKLIKKLLPMKMKSQIKNSLGIIEMEQRLEGLEDFVRNRIDKIENIILKGDMWSRSRARWRESVPDAGLTWQQELSGDNFIKKIWERGCIPDNCRILDVGPGYGRIFNAFGRLGIKFKRYIGLDISTKSVNYLNKKFQNDSVEFLVGDIESFEFLENFDLVVSSLTFKHLFPSFKNAILNISKYLKTDGYIVFDLIEGDEWTIEAGSDTYIRNYSKEEVQELLREIGFLKVEFDYVEHAPGFTRLLVLASK